MHVPEDFIPDFTQKVFTGAICNRKSSIKCHEGLVFISIYNKVNAWNLNTNELICSFGNRKITVSTFEIHDQVLIIGYEDGIVEIHKNYSTSEPVHLILKLHTRKVTSVLCCSDVLYTSSLDGTICCYDMLIENIKYYLTGNTSAVESIHTKNTNELIAICSDRSIKTWGLASTELKDAIVFEEDVFEALVHGNEMFVILRSGESYIVNCVTKEKKGFTKYKNIRKVIAKEGFIYVQCQKSMQVYQITKEESFGLVCTKNYKTRAEHINFDVSDGIVYFISKDNQICRDDQLIDFGFHRNEVIEIKTVQSKIYSLSKDKLVCWNRTAENPMKADNKTIENIEEYTTEFLNVFWSIDIANATSFDFFANNIFVGTSEGLVVIDQKFNEITSKIALGTVSCVSASDAFLSVAVDNNILFYDYAFNQIASFTVPETVTHSVLTNKFFYCSCLDNKIYQFSYPSMDLRITMYGHSLPVRSFSLSTDEKQLISCGADKLVKLWGLEFGDCRKTFIGDSKGASFLNETLFMFCTDFLQYFNNFDSLKKYKVFQAGVVAPGTDYIAVASDRGIALLTMNKYEFVAEEDSSEMQELADRSIANIREYDTFLEHLERLENAFNDVNITLFYRFLEKIDFNELRQYVYVLDHASIAILLRVILRSIDKNAIVLSRLFLQLFRCHKDTCLSLELFSEVWNALNARIVQIRHTFNENEARIELDINNIEN